MKHFFVHMSDELRRKRSAFSLDIILKMAFLVKLFLIDVFYKIYFGFTLQMSANKSLQFFVFNFQKSALLFKDSPSCIKIGINKIEGFYRHFRVKLKCVL